MATTQASGAKVDKIPSQSGTAPEYPVCFSEEKEMEPPEVGFESFLGLPTVLWTFHAYTFH